MTIKDIFSLAIRLMGVIFFYALVVSLPSYIMMIADSMRTEDIKSTYFFAASFILFIHAVLIYYCLFKAESIVKLITTKKNSSYTDKSLSGTIDKETVTYFVVILAGIWLVVNVIPDLSHFLIENYTWYNAELYQTTDRKLYLDFMYYGLRLVTGMAFIYFNKPIVTYILQRSEPQKGSDTN